MIQNKGPDALRGKMKRENSNGQYEGMESVRLLVNSFRKPDKRSFRKGHTE